MAADVGLCGHSRDGLLDGAGDLDAVEPAQLLGGVGVAAAKGGLRNKKYFCE